MCDTPERSGHLSIEGAVSDTPDRVAVTYPGQTKLIPWVKSGDRYAVQGVLNHLIYREVTATRSRASSTM